MTNLTQKQILEFYRKRKQIPGVVLKVTNKHETIYGARSVNKQIKPVLRTHTQDFDIYTQTPRKDAKELERALERKFKGNQFKVEKAKHPGTIKVKSNVTSKTIADYTKEVNKVSRKKIGRHYYVPLSEIKKSIKKTLQDPTSKYRHSKDKATLTRIRVHETLSKKPIKRKTVKRKTTRRKKK